MSQRPMLVFFDMNVWVSMSKGLADRDKRWEAIAHKARGLVADEAVRFVLSSSSYLELWHRRDRESRENVGRVMRDLTQYATFAPVDTIRSMEVESFVQRHVGRSQTINAENLVGQGACHAFGSPFGRFRFVDSIASADGTTPEGRAAPAPENWLDLKREGPQWEWFNLVGTQEVLEVGGLERTPQHRIGNSRVANEMHLREVVTTQPWAKARIRDLVITGEIMALTDEINKACWVARTQPHGLFLENPAFDTPPEAMRAFVGELPSVDTLVTLREWKHRDLNHEWHQHDQSDLLSLAVAVPYADVVVTERRWAHLCRASGLSAKYGTQVCAMRDLEHVLDTLEVAS